VQLNVDDFQQCVRFNPTNPVEIICNGARQVNFCDWSSGDLVVYSPVLSSKDFRQTIGSFTQSIFIPHSSLAVSATVDGDVVLWDAVGNPAIDKKAIKMIRLHNASIDLITCIDQYIVSGSDDGIIRCFDFQFRIVAWFEDLNAGGIRSVSFAHPSTHAKDHTGDTTLDVANFVVSTDQVCIPCLTPLCIPCLTHHVSPA
jgi:WD40 repeat protein